MRSDLFQIGQETLCIDVQFGSRTISQNMLKYVPDWFITEDYDPIT